MPEPTTFAVFSDEVQRLEQEACTAFLAASTLQALEAARVSYLGRQEGALTARRKAIGLLPTIEDKKAAGGVVNATWAVVEQAYAQRLDVLTNAEKAAQSELEALDLTTDPLPFERGYFHPITEVVQSIRSVFGSLGYRFVEGPEVEYDRYNFTFVNMPPDHPSRDTQDTYFIDEARVLRTQTSSVQVRAMRTYGAPMSAIVIGRCFRRDNDATHSPIFYQAEGICIDQDISLADLKGTLVYFMQSFFGADRAIRLRPHHFPFTEPSFEIDISCMRCSGSGCHLCKKSGWIEVLGSGMIHPKVLEYGCIDPKLYRGFAFGVGLERMAMLKYDIQHIRLLYENDIRFLQPKGTI